MRLCVGSRGVELSHLLLAAVAEVLYYVLPFLPSRQMNPFSLHFTCPLQHAWPEMEMGMCAQVPVIIKVPMARFQGAAYSWIKATGTLRLDPDSALSAATFRAYAPLNNKVMELRKVTLPACPIHTHLCGILLWPVPVCTCCPAQLALGEGFS